MLYRVATEKIHIKFPDNFLIFHFFSFFILISFNRNFLIFQILFQFFLIFLIEIFWFFGFSTVKTETFTTQNWLHSTPPVSRNHENFSKVIKPKYQFLVFCFFNISENFPCFRPNPQCVENTEKFRGIHAFDIFIFF